MLLKDLNKLPDFKSEFRNPMVFQIKNKDKYIIFELDVENELKEVCFISYKKPASRLRIKLRKESADKEYFDLFIQIWEQYKKSYKQLRIRFLSN